MKDVLTAANDRCLRLERAIQEALETLDWVPVACALVNGLEQEDRDAAACPMSAGKVRALNRLFVDLTEILHAD